MVHEYKANNITFPYERQASNGDKMPDGLDYPDKVIYLCFRMLYAQLKRGDIDRDTAVREKRKIMREYEAYKFVEQLNHDYVNIIRSTEVARSMYRKDRTLENADKLLAAIDGVWVDRKFGDQG